MPSHSCHSWDISSGPASSQGLTPSNSSPQSRGHRTSLPVLDSGRLTPECSDTAVPGLVSTKQGREPRLRAPEGKPSCCPRGGGRTVLHLLWLPVASGPSSPPLGRMLVRGTTVPSRPPPCPQPALRAQPQGPAGPSRSHAPLQPCEGTATLPVTLPESSHRRGGPRRLRAPAVCQSCSEHRGVPSLPLSRRPEPTATSQGRTSRHRRVQAACGEQRPPGPLACCLHRAASPQAGTL